MEWQPIETAPKDGTHILVVNNEGEMDVMVWSDESSAGGDWRDPYDIGGGMAGIAHWMPLPEPPHSAPATPR